MNLGERIKTYREKADISIEDLAKQINDTIENVNKYENNEVEPTLDKKLAIAIALGVGLDDLSYNIEKTNKKHTYTSTDEHVEENQKEESEVKEPEIIEIPFANSTITFTEALFNKIFKKDYNRYYFQFFISLLGYIFVAIYAFLYNMDIIGYLCSIFGVYSIVKAIIMLARFKKGKKEWLTQFNHVQKTYQYFNEYILIRSNDERYPEVRFYYRDIFRAIESEDLIICIINGEQKVILTIDKSTLDSEGLIKVRTAIQNNCFNYLNATQTISQDKTQIKKNKALDICLWILVGLSALSLFYGAIFNLTGFDNTIVNQVIVYILAMIFPILSIIMGIVAKKKFHFPSKKNIIVGIILLVICAFNLMTSLVSHMILVSNNNYPLVETIKKNTNTLMPNDFYTIYSENKKTNIEEDEAIYYIETYQIWIFNQKKEIEALEETIKNPNSKWKKRNEEMSYKNIVSINENAKTILMDLGYDTSKTADYYLLLNLNTNQLDELNYQSGDKYLLLAYYDSSNYMIAIEFTCLPNNKVE